jgi:hypothetical protein
MDPTIPFLADERVRQLRHDANLVRAGRGRRYRRTLRHLVSRSRR